MKSKIYKFMSLIVCVILIAFTWAGKENGNFKIIEPVNIEPDKQVMESCQPINKTEANINTEAALIETPIESKGEFENDVLLPELPQIEVNMEDAILLAKTAWGEFRGLNDEEVLAVYWCILNRVDSSGHGMGGNIESVVSFPGQFLGYNINNPIDERLFELACNVLREWEKEKQTGELSAERVIPPKYLWFSGNDQQTHNIYRDTYLFQSDTDYILWENNLKITLVN